MRFDQLIRRDFIRLLLGGAAAWPVAARGQQQAMPLIGFLRGTSSTDSGHLVEAFRQGVRQAGFVEGQDCTRTAVGNKLWR
jgi:putative tryptophan/tyrosine transport system substrate-binding protein